jgi:hypothetical protein
MSDSDFIDVGDELVVKISGYPVASTAIVVEINTHVIVELLGSYFVLPLNVKDYDTVDGVAHNG